MSQHRVYALASGKGGVGKTTSAVNIGAALADAGHTAVVVDADLGMANLTAVLDVDVDEATLHDVLAGEATVREATYSAGQLAVVPGGTSLSAFAGADPKRLTDALATLREVFDYVLVDVGAGLSHDTVLPLDLVDAVLLVSTFDRPAIENVVKVTGVTERLDAPVAGLVLTRVTADASPPIDALESQLDVPVLAVVPEDRAIHRSLERGVPATVAFPDAPAAEVYSGLAAVLDGQWEGAVPVASTASTGAAEPSAATTEDAPETPDAADADDAVTDATADSEEAIVTDTGEDGATGGEPTVDADEPADAADEAAADADDEPVDADVEDGADDEDADSPDDEGADEPVGAEPAGEKEGVADDTVDDEVDDAAAVADDADGEADDGGDETVDDGDETVDDEADQERDETDEASDTSGGVTIDTGPSDDGIEGITLSEAGASADDDDDSTDESPPDEPKKKKKGLLRRLFG